MPVKKKGVSPKNYTNRLSTLQKMFDEKTLGILIEIGNEIVEMIRNYIDKEWYRKYKPKDYKRTYDLKDSVSYRITKKQIQIFFDRRKFSKALVNDGNGWQPHRGFDKQEFVDGLIDFLDDGIGKGGSKKNPRHGQSGIDLLDYAEAIINRYAEDMLELKMKTLMEKYL